MKLFCSASKDTYITNKIINNRLVADDANVGRAGTLDLFRLYGETTLRGTGSQDEVSRLLVSFNLKPIKSRISDLVDIRSDNFSAKLKLFDVKSGHAVPSNFNVIVFPLSRSFDEGVGRDISSFGDIDVANFLTRSYSEGTANLWHMSGANSQGTLGADNIDIIGRADLNDGDGEKNIWVSQKFLQGTEDLEVDVTEILSATLANQIPDLGFRISLSGSEEKDTKSRFVKRFASRHVANPHIRPRIEVSFDDTIHDNRSNFLFDVSGSLFLQNYARSKRANILSGSALSVVTGSNCMKLKLKKGSFSFVTNVSQHTRGTSDTQIPGLYSASFALPSNLPTLYDGKNSISSLIASQKEVTFKEFWYSTDGNVGYHTGSLTVRVTERTSDSFSNMDPEVYTLNVKNEYRQEDQDRVRVFGIDHGKTYTKAVKKPVRRSSEIFEEVYYRVVDRDTGYIALSFGESDNSTRVSTDKEGMYFDINFNPLPKGRSYQFEFLVKHKGVTVLVPDSNSIFRVT